MLEAMAPAAIEASVALAKNLEAERAAIDHHWRQRRERAAYEVERSAPAICGGGAGEPAGGADARARLGGDLE